MRDAAAAAVRDAPLPVAETSGVEYHLAHGDWIRLLRANGFEILDLIEIQAPADAETHEHYAYVTADWARKWPAEEIWRARLQPPLLLASTSPRRREILEQLRIPFDVVAPDYEETEDDPVAHARRQGAVGARRGRRPARARLRHRGRPATAASTASRPAPRRPRRCSRRLAGRTHEVVSGLALITPMLGRGAHEMTRVTFRGLTPRDIARYVASGEWEGRAGALRDPGPGRGARRADRGRLPQRRRPPGGAARPAPRRALPRHVRVRMSGVSPVASAARTRRTARSPREARARSGTAQRHSDALPDVEAGPAKAGRSPRQEAS